ncbi:MAG: DUF2334 domain-containing protein [bacterium]
MKVIFRDDDVGLNCDCLEEILDIFEENNIPISLSVIPSRLDVETLDILRKYIKNGNIEIIQHGFSHFDYNRIEGEKILGKKIKTEFPDWRSELGVKQDIKIGKERLEKTFKSNFTPILTLPWHHISEKHYNNIKDFFIGVSSREMFYNEKINIDFVVTHFTFVGGVFYKSQDIIKTFKKGTNIILLHHQNYKGNEDKLNELRKIIKYIKENNIEVIKFRDLI